MPVIIHPPGTPLPEGSPLKGNNILFGIKPPKGWPPAPNKEAEKPDSAELPASGVTSDVSSKKGPSHLSVAWPPFALKLAATLEKLDEDQFLIISVKRSNWFVQFAAQGSFGMRVEAPSSSFLSVPEQLNERQIVSMLEAGWHSPTGSPTESTPELDPDGSPNFFAEFSTPVSFKGVANLAVRTLAEILRVPHPGFLEYKAFGEKGKAIALPELGLRIEKHPPEVDNQAELSKLLLATIRKITGISDLDYDINGDIGIRHGSTLMYVRLIDDPLYVRITSPILCNVEQNPDISARLNDINASVTLMRFFFQNGVIYGVADISAVPFVSDHVAQALVQFGSMAEGFNNLLQDEFGGNMVLKG